MLIDTHTHLYSSQFDEDRDEIVRRAKENGVQRVYLPSIDSAYYDSMLAMEENDPEWCKLMIGLHPCHVKENYREELDFVEKQLEKRPFAAIGEIGMDLYWDKTFQKQQREALEIQIDWADSYKLPIILHVRNAFDELFEGLEAKKSKNPWGIFHCFSGNLEQARRAISMGFKLGIGGVVTFKNSGLDKVMQEISLEDIVLETDSPYLAPTPYRGKRNETSYISLVVDKLAEIKEVSKEEVIEITGRNAEDLFIPYSL